MAYVPWSVVFGEQPSAAKWNLLGTNDSNFDTRTTVATKALSSSSTISNNLKVQTGWDFIQGTGAGNATKAVTFPSAFGSTPIAILVSPLGTTSGSDPTSLSNISSSVGGDQSNMYPKGSTWSTTGFTCENSAVSGQTLGATTRFSFSWIAIGSS